MASSPEDTAPIRRPNPVAPPADPAMTVPNRRVSDRTSPAGPAVTPPASLAPHLCPQCRVPLIDPDGMGLCPRCGFCRSVVAADPAPALAPAAPEPTPTTRPGSDWLWLAVLNLGAVAVVLATWAAARTLPPGGRERAVWAAAQLLVGFATLYLGQALAILLTARDDIGTRRAEWLVISRRVWADAVGRLPGTRWPVWLGAWGLMLMLSSVLVLGLDGLWRAPAR